ncbi:sorting nexin-29-like isoform X2 [Planococcus citri]|uniref:sorting nexin-29-like isoform X2 n=1 Tax=Planococcus citri TaxID=170843 RepID=UPI0031F9300F
MDADALAQAEIDKNHLQSDLLTAVKECQKKYGGRIELATELDSHVSRVCFCFEAVFNHGLKRTISKKSTKAFCINEKPTFWLCISHILSQHERDRYNSLKNVKSNWGKGRAWLRSALNERSLERYLQSLIFDEILLAEYYEELAFLRDQEKSNILPTAAAGLVPILFAISIDREDLNHRNNDCGIDKFNSEQVILTESMDVLKINDVRRKIQNNIIEFDDTCENNGNYDEINASVCSPCDISTVEIAEDAADTILKNEHSAYFNNDSEDNVSMGLRPISDEGVGELIPVSTDINNADDSTLFSDFPSEDGISVGSTDDQGFQKLYESAKEELKKQLALNSTLDARVHELNRENEVLKHQLRKYVSAVQMLKQEDADHTFEAQLYEKKLVQVAEMHGELMELNNRLQISLLAKEEMNKRLQEELISLRGPLPSEDFSLHKLVSLWVPSVFLTGRYADPHHVYQVHFRIGSEEWNVYRRYAQFHAFHQKLKKEYSIASGFHFPPKKTIGNKDANFVEERRKKIQLYLRQVINFLLTQDSHLAVNPTKALFTSRVQFFSEQYKEGNQSRSHSIFGNCLQQPQNDTEDTLAQYSGL